LDGLICDLPTAVGPTGNRHSNSPTTPQPSKPAWRWWD